VDDHEAVRKGIRALLSTYSILTVCAEASDGTDAIEKAGASRPDIVLMDITMPGMNGLDATREIKRILPETKVVIVSQHEAPEVIRQAMSAGANGYVTKSNIGAELIPTIQRVANGESVFEGANEQHQELGKLLQTRIPMNPKADGA